MTPPGKNIHVHFTGKIEKVSDAARVDGDSYIIVDGKKILFNSGAQYQSVPFGPIDPAIDLGSDIQGKKYIGKTVEVQAIKDPEYNTLSLRSPGTYIKLLDRTFKDTKLQGVVEWAGVDTMGALATGGYEGLGHILLTNGTKIIYKDPSIFAVEPHGTIKSTPQKGDKIEAFVTKVQGDSYWRDNSPAYTLYGKKSYYIKVK